MDSRHTLEELFVNAAWKDSLDAKNIKNVVDEFYAYAGDDRADKFADSLKKYKLGRGRFYLADMQAGIEEYAFTLLTAGVVGSDVRKRLDSGFVVYLKATQVLSHLETYVARKDYEKIDYKSALEDLSRSWTKHISKI